MRTLPGRPGLDHQRARVAHRAGSERGSCSCSHTSAVADFDAIEDDAAVDQHYIDEMTELLHRGDRGGEGRRARRWEEALRRERHRQARGVEQRQAGPISARRQHRRFGCRSSSTSSCSSSTTSSSSGTHAGRCTTCGARSRHRRRTSRSRCATRASIAPADEVTVTALTIGTQRHHRPRHHGYLYNPAHRWHYFRDMRPDEVLVFKAHDTDPRRAGRVPHTAFTDPTCPPGTPTRASVEMRGLAFFD